MPEQVLNSKIAKSFENIVNKGALPPSMLFSGPEKSGKFDFAINLMMALNCAEHTGENITPCNLCRNCRRIKQTIFPDLHIIEAEGKSIKVDRVRKLKADLALKPYEAKKRIIVIKDSDLLGKESGNALLKIMEEPPLNTHFILIAKNYMDVLPTIRSRCHCFRFFPENRLHEKTEELFSIKELSSLIDDTREEVFTSLIKIFMDRQRINAGGIIFISEYISGKKGDPEIFLLFLLIFFRDIIIYKSNGNYIYLESLKETMAESSYIEDEKLFKIFDILFKALEMIKGNINAKILIESSLLKIQAILNE